MPSRRTLYANSQKHFLNCPHVIGDSRFHRGRAAKCLVNPAEVVMHAVNRHCVSMVLDFLGESIGKAGEPSHTHAHCEILALDIGRADLSPAGATHNPYPLAASADRGTVTSFLLACRIGFNEHCVINLRTERAFNCLKINLQAIRAGSHGQCRPDRGPFSCPLPLRQPHVVNRDGARRYRRLL